MQKLARVDSDLDLAVLVQGYADPLQLWETAGSLADISGCAVDYRAQLYEVAVLNEKFAFRWQFWGRWRDSDSPKH